MKAWIVLNKCATIRQTVKRQNYAINLMMILTGFLFHVSASICALRIKKPITVVWAYMNTTTNEETKARGEIELLLKETNII
ncbi:Uncharacterised protein [Escherichia coli]|uniref:Uncharacterized protein n=1 Tax=Escherichia coli TaxID=562 RepID=A0AAX2KP05_ECOLX|nr:Uncharacterised protein [Escherichia coli]